MEMLLKLMWGTPKLSEQKQSLIGKLRAADLVLCSLES
jgi:hypothetical protein